MKKFAFGLVAALALASAAHAADPMAGVYGNTVSILYPDKTIDTLYIKQDGSYVLDSPTIGYTRGTWTASGGQTCFTQTEPASDQPPACSATVSKKPGDSWQGVGRGGVPVTISIDEGM